MKTHPLCFVPLALACASTALAADTPSFKLFGAASYVSPLAEDDITLGMITDSVQASEEVGWNVGLEVRPNRIVGLELDYINATNDIEFGGQVIGDVHMQPVSATLNFHVIPTRVVDLYIGPTASYFIWGDADLGTGPKLKTDDEFAYGASLGLEIGLGKTFALLGGVRWLKADLEPEGTSKIGVDPLFSRVGVALRF